MSATTATVHDLRVRRRRRDTLVVALLALALAGTFAFSLMYGQKWYGPDVVARVLAGQDVPGASFTVGDLRLPRALLAVTSGAALGLAGVIMQTLLRNPLASPDIIGISSGASAGAVLAITVLSLSSTGVALSALAGALLTGLLIHVCAWQGSFSATRLILVGVGIGTGLQALVTYGLSRASTWDLATAMRWINGSLTNAGWAELTPLLVALAATAPFLVVADRRIPLLALGDQAATSLGVRVVPLRLGLFASSVTLLALATCAAGPVAFVPFMSGPIATRLVSPGARPLASAALVGALLVSVADLVGQFALPARYPVGIVTGVIGAPVLIHLLIRVHRQGTSQ